MAIIADKLHKAATRLRKGDLEGAWKQAETARRRAPASPQPLVMLGRIALQAGRYHQAREALEQAVQRDSQDARSLYLLGYACMQQGDPAAAVLHLSAACEVDPELGEAYNRLCAVLGQSGRIMEAARAGERAIELLPDSADAYTNLGSVYEIQGRLDAALRCREQAARLLPSHPRIQHCLANALLAVGQTEAAEKHYRKALELKPDFAPPWRILVRLHRYSNPDAEDALKIREQLEKVPEADRGDLHFALGKIYDDCGVVAEAFEQFQLANRIENARHNFDIEALRTRVDAVVAAFTPEFFRARAGFGVESEQPVFIVGMPRSGTTLVESILAAHKDVFAGGELYWFGELDRLVEQAVGGDAAYPRCVRELSSEHCRQLAEDYLDYLRQLTDGEAYLRITDKLLSNLFHLGMLHLVFPQARIIHCRRDPMDTCFSIYKIKTPDSLPFAYDLENVAHMYNCYRRLMHHWEKVLPQQIMTIDYESLVSNQVDLTQRLLDFVGLPWDEACVQFHANKAMTRTLSAEQVREPLHARSIGRWQAYETFLEPMRKILEQDGLG
ncbi:MAG: hypothetical protein CMN57_00290 [Gammaproteobacteria bacterium]|nr:hypothetical protein [Gammaproteobacteria bacterium]